MKKATPERRAELLVLARKSRLKWILDGADYTLAHPHQDSVDFFRKVPAATCLQNILNFLSDLASDGEKISIETLAPPDSLDEDRDESAPIPTYESGTSPYLIFLEKLKHPDAIDIVKMLQQFVTKIDITVSQSRNASRGLTSSNDSDDEVAKEIWAFLHQVQSNMRSNPLWVNESVPQWERTIQSSEKFLLTKLYNTLFFPDPLSRQHDEELSQRIQSLSFLTPEHLDTRCLSQAWSLRGQAIRKDSGVIEVDGDEGSGVARAVATLLRMQDERNPIDKVHRDRYT
jgi:hypothetical protein